LNKKVNAKAIARGALLSRPIFVSNNIGPDEALPLARKLAPLNQVPLVTAAQVVVSSTLVLEKMGERLAFAVMLCGMTVVKPDYLLGDGGGKACLVCLSAVRTWRRVFLSDGFKGKYPALVDIIAAASQLPKSKWKILDTLEGYNNCRANAPAAKQKYVIAVKRSSEHIPGIHGDASEFTKEEFFAEIRYVDMLSTTGSF